MSRARAIRWLVFAVLAIGVFALAVSGDVYNATSPPAFGWHVAARKLYSLAAFAMLGTAYTWARGRVRVADAALAIAIYSGSIEIGQWFFSDERLAWNVGDVAFGAAGGALGAPLARLLDR